MKYPVALAALVLSLLAGYATPIKQSVAFDESAFQPYVGAGTATIVGNRLTALPNGPWPTAAVRVKRRGAKREHKNGSAGEESHGGRCDKPGVGWPVPNSEGHTSRKNPVMVKSRRRGSRRVCL